MQLDDLWNFMQVDMEADKFENQMRLSPNRQKLLKQRNFILEQQNNMKKLEADVAVMQDRLAAVKTRPNAFPACFPAWWRSWRRTRPPPWRRATARAEAAQHLADTLTRYEQELAKMRKDAEARDRQQKEIRVRAAKHAI